MHLKVLIDVVSALIIINKYLAYKNGPNNIPEENFNIQTSLNILVMTKSQLYQVLKPLKLTSCTNFSVLILMRPTYV